MTVRAKRAVGLGVVTLLAVVAVFVACIVDLGDGPRRVVAGDITREVIVPTYDEVVVRANALATAATQFAQAPAPASLSAVRDAWRSAREPWKRTDAFRFGPPSLQSLGV